MRRRRAFIIAGYWLFQAGAIYVLWPVFFEPELLTRKHDVWAGMLTSGEYVVRVAATIAGLTAMQFAFVRPVLPPAIRRGPDRRGWRRIACSLPSGIASAAAVAFALALLWELAAATIWGWDVVEFSEAADRAKSINFFSVFLGGTIALTPALMWRCRGGTPVWLSAAIAAFAIAAMLAALVSAVLGGVDHFAADLPEDAWRWGCLLPVLIGWAVTTPLLIAFIRCGPRESALSRIASWIFLGTVVETAAVLPLDLVIRKRSSCYCGEGTFWALTLLGSVGFFALGPAVYLLPLGRRRRRWAQGRCEVCGYDMKATPRADRCPECGSGWRGDAPPHTGART